MAISPNPTQTRIVLSHAQGLVYRSKARFRVVCAGRRFGKTHLAIAIMLFAALEAPGRMIWFVAPTYRQASQVAWKILKSLVTKEYRPKINETDLSLELPNGSIIALRGADNYDSLRGVGLDGLVMDEFQDIQPDAWEEVLRPALSDRMGWALMIGTPKGFSYFHTLWTKAHIEDGWEPFSFSTLEGGRVPPQEVESARRDLDPRKFRQEYEASFESMTGLVYQNFDRKIHIRDDLKDTGGNLLVGMDFNVNPMSALIGVRVGDQLHILDEIEQENSDTQRMADELRRRYPKRNITVYPDPSGHSRRSSSEHTDHAILRHAGFVVIAPPKAPPVTDRINEVNAMFTNAAGAHRLFISKRASQLIKCLEGLVYMKNSMEPDKRLGLDHLVDALGYLIHSEFPIVSRKAKVREFRL